MFKAIVINPNCNILNINITENSVDNVISFRGYGTIKNIYTWEFETLEVIVLGWDTGNHNNINKMEMPEPLDTKLLFGDIIILMKENGEYIDFTKNDFNEFYNEMMEYSDSCNSADDTDLENDEYDLNDDFIDNLE
jgi:hypothetical protein